MTSDPHCIGPDTTLLEAVRTMKRLDANILPVCENDRIVATITDQDIVVRAADSKCDPRTSTVRELMGREMICCSADHDIQEAAQIMKKNHVRRLPVLNQNQQLVGILSKPDVAAHPQGSGTVAGILAPPPVSVS